MHCMLLKMPLLLPENGILPEYPALRVLLPLVGEADEVSALRSSRHRIPFLNTKQLGSSGHQNATRWQVSKKIEAEMVLPQLCTKEKRGKNQVLVLGTTWIYTLSELKLEILEGLCLNNTSVFRVRSFMSFIKGYAGMLFGWLLPEKV